jgi:dTDP-L-rhamnose 4-epimerase
MVGLGVDFGDAGAYVAHNDAGTAALLEVLHHRRFAGRLVVASSMVVYGEGRYRCPDDGVVRPAPRQVDDLERGVWEPRCPQCGSLLAPEPIDEDAALDPRNVYAATKLHQEHLGACFAREHPDVAVVALRYHNVYGPRMPSDTPYAGVASLFRSALEAGRPPQVFEDGAQLRDFVHVRDVARANRLALEGRGTESGFAAFNVASGHPRTVGEMAVALCTAFGEPELAPEIVPRFRLGDVRHVIGSPDRATRELGFRATVPFEEGVHEFAAAPLRARVAR